MCFSKTYDNDYSFALFGDRMTYLAFTRVSEAKTFIFIAYYKVMIYRFSLIIYRDLGTDFLLLG